MHRAGERGVKPLQAGVLWWLRCLQAPGSTQRCWISAGIHTKCGGWAGDVGPTQQCQDPKVQMPGPSCCQLCPEAALAKTGQAGLGSAESSVRSVFLVPAGAGGSSSVPATVPRAQSCPRAPQLSPAHSCGGRAARQEGGTSCSMCSGSWGHLGSSAVPPCIYLLREWARRNKD